MLSVRVLKKAYDFATVRGESKLQNPPSFFPSSHIVKNKAHHLNVFDSLRLETSLSKASSFGL